MAETRNETTSHSFNKISCGDINIFECELVLQDGNKIVIPMRETDGWINATLLCKAGGKRLNNWMRLKETKDFIEILKKKSLLISESTAILEIKQGGNDKFNQGTWIHPDLGLNLAQWISPSFSVQVSRWIRELLITGQVVLGNEKKEEEIKAIYEEKISTLEEEIKKRDIALMTEKQKTLYMTNKYKKVYQNHQAYLERKNVYHLKDGNCVYLLKMRENDDLDTIGFKIGRTDNLTNRIGQYRTSNPFCKLLYVMYVEDNVFVEKFIKTKYNKNLLMKNREFIVGVDSEEVAKSMKNFVELSDIPYKIESLEELTEFNSHIVLIDEEKTHDVLKEPEIVLKRCGGALHKTEEERMLTLDKFHKNKGNVDGVNRICKQCYKFFTFGENCKIVKVVPIPPHDNLIEKWCNKCEKIKPFADFYHDKMTKDGLNANCKSCKADQKKIYMEKKKLKN